jgi:hypothetical protein
MNSFVVIGYGFITNTSSVFGSSKKVELVQSVELQDKS